MKYCSRCGAQLNDENQQFCKNCGAKLCADPAAKEQNDTTLQTTYPQEQVMQNPVYPAQNMNTAPSMKWFKFLIYFSLFAGAVLNAGRGILFISGDIYFSQSNGQVTAEMVYSMFSELKAIDTFFGVAQILLGGFGIFTRFRLSQYRKNGPLCLHILYGAAIGLSLIYSIAGMIICDVAPEPTEVSSFIASVVILISNIRYFRKRKDLFTN